MPAPEIKPQFAAKLAGSLLPVIDAAEMIGVTRRAVINYIHAGLLDATQVGRAWLVTAQSVQSFVDQRHAAAQIMEELKAEGIDTRLKEIQTGKRKSGTGA